MKLAIGTALLVFLAGSAAYAQEQDKDKQKEKPTQQEPRKQEPAAKERPQAQERQQKAQEHQQKAQQQEEQQQKNQTKQSEREKSDADRHQQEAARQQEQQQVGRQDHATSQGQQAQRDGGNRNSRRISEQDFHFHFGREHRFRVTRSEDRRFNYGGYYFVYNDPWPSDWAYTDDVYVDEIDGEYYLIDPVHPGIRLLVIID